MVRDSTSIRELVVKTVQQIIGANLETQPLPVLPVYLERGWMQELEEDRKTAHGVSQVFSIRVRGEQMVLNSGFETLLPHNLKYKSIQWT